MVPTLDVLYVKKRRQPVYLVLLFSSLNTTFVKKVLCPIILRTRPAGLVYAHIRVATNLHIGSGRGSVRFGS